MFTYHVDHVPNLLLAVEGDEDEGSLQGVEQDERVPQSRDAGQSGDETKDPTQSHDQRQFDVEQSADAQLVVVTRTPVRIFAAHFPVRLVLINCELIDE